MNGELWMMMVLRGVLLDLAYDEPDAYFEAAEMHYVGLLSRNMPVWNSLKI